MLGTPGQLGGDLVDEGTRLRPRDGRPHAVGVRHHRQRRQWSAPIDGGAARRGHQRRGLDAVDAAEEHEAEAEAVNGTGAGHRRSGVRARAGIRCCHVSTDYVFDGTATAPIPEDAVPSPRSAYGRTKWHGEIAVREHCPDHLIVRTSWLYGRQGPNFVLDDAAPGVRASRAPRGRRSARCANLDRASRAGDAPAARDRTCRDLSPHQQRRDHLVRPRGRDHPRARARHRGRADHDCGIPDFPTARPAYSVLDNRAWRELGEPPLPDWQDGLRATSRASTPLRWR